MELEQRVRREFEDNPFVEDTSSQKKEDDDQPKDVSIDEMKEDDSIPAYRLQVNNYGKDERPEYDTFSVKQSFQQSLMEQLGFRHLNSHQHDIAAFIIGSLDSDGYLRRPIPNIVDDLSFRAGVETDEEEVLELLFLIQEFEPAGVGARDLQECLLLQLENMKDSEPVKNARKIIGEYFREFSNKHFAKIAQKESLTDEQMRLAIKKIMKLNPAPGGQIEDTYDDRAQQIVPDFVLDYDGAEFHLSMPRFNIPEIRVAGRYAKMIEDAKGSDSKTQKEAVTFVKKKIDDMKWFVEALKQRYNTLEKTMNAIIDYQHDYFIDGDESNLRPMVLKDIAEKTGFDISTISRVVNSKYIETHFGIFKLKYFFSEGLENQDGVEVSTRELKKSLLELVDGEDKTNPLTDDELVQKMTEKGYKVARRTIAKYRDQLGIPKARLRRDI